MTCKHLGSQVKGPEREARRLGHWKNWRWCLHVLRPHGDAVCQCEGKCNEKCGGYEPKINSANLLN